MKRHPFTSHPHDDNCWRCYKPREAKCHVYKSVLYSLGARPVRCPNDTCGMPIYGSKVPARDFLVGRYSMLWRQEWCRHCHTPFKLRRAVKGGDVLLEVVLLDDYETGRLPTMKPIKLLK